MAPEKVDSENDDATANCSTVSIESTTSEHDAFFEPVVCCLPEVQVKTNEEDEEEMLKLRCKLFRYQTGENAEWKERGTGDVKLLKHSQRGTVRLLMRQDKTLKIRANHYITPYMKLLPNCGSDRAWVWSVPADFADEEPKQELFAIKFANSENASIFKEKVSEAMGFVNVAVVKSMGMFAGDEKPAAPFEKESTSSTSKEEESEPPEANAKVQEESKTPTMEDTSGTKTSQIVTDMSKLSVLENGNHDC